MSFRAKLSTAAISLLLTGCQSVNMQQTDMVVPTVKVPLVRYKMSERPNIPWSAEHDYKAVLVNSW